MDFYSRRLMYADCRVEYSDDLVHIPITLFRVFRIRILPLKKGQLIIGKF